ncbi:MAG: septal ring lytic transglycosylase RlpA family protein [Gammaproteobacteria bacterium]|jgi:rare lipoprotein A
MPTTAASPEWLRHAGAGLAGLSLAALLAACASAPSGRYSQEHDSAPVTPVDVSDVREPIPRAEPRSRYGNPSSYVVRGRRYHTLASSAGYRERGIASWYGTKFHGHRTSSGDTYDMYQMSAAHKTLPLPTYARVRNLRNGASVIVKINDRGPFHENRLIDLSYAAASRLGILGEGTGLVEVETIDPVQYARRQGAPKIAASKPKLPSAASAEVVAERQDTALYLQVGAFAKRSNAERLHDELAGMQLPGKLHISEGLSDEKPVYRVRIGPLSTVQSADEVAQRLSLRGIQSPSVVID